ncbi:MAG TPA: methyltransferase, partial [Solirubrobacteraceae bacterium]|nr:methyltransferase [Solirubrobacteraceae bacterium]
ACEGSGMPKAVAGFAAALRAADYSVRGVRTAIGSGAAVTIAPADRHVAQRRLDRASALGRLIGLFFLGVSLPVGEAAAAVAPVPLDALATAGVVGCDGEIVRARIRVLPYEDLLVACDRDPDPDERLEQEHVGGIHTSTVQLALLTPRRPVERALDIGCGCGFQTLLLARHANEVVGTDVNPRAIEFGRLNAELNGIENISWRLGEGFEPVRGERFDLVVSNPPFVIAPRPRFTFRESPLPGDAFCEELVRDAPGSLSDDGVACLLASWIVGPDEDWAARPTAWTSDVDQGRLLLHLETVDAAANATGWAVPPGAVSPAEADALVDEWLEYYRANAIERIAYGAVILHPTPALTRIELGGTPGPEACAHVERIIEGHALLAAGSSTRLIDALLAPPPGLRLDWTLRVADGAWQMQRSRLSVDGGLGLGVEVDRDTARVVARLDGRRTLRAVLDAEGTDASLDGVRELLRAGLIAVIRPQ